MANFLLKIVLNQCPAGRSHRFNVVLRLCPLLVNNMTKPKLSNYEYSSRRNMGQFSISKVESLEDKRRQFESDKSYRRQFFNLLLAVGASTLFSGFLWYCKRKQSTTDGLRDVFFLSPFTFSTVHAASVDDSLPPSRRFNFIADVVEKAAPGVVYIELKERLPFTNKRLTIANGSGFIVRGDGLILTNAHVVANKTVVNIKLYSGQQVEGQVVAVDPISDLACIKINMTGLPALRMGKSSNLRAGEWVVAMGSPLALSNTVTSGIVSSVSRHSKDLGLRNKDMDYIQTDALINFGNSGGPLVNLDGEVIGINTMKVTPGISFAIPSDYASSFLYKVDEVLSKGKPGAPQKRQWFTMGDTSDRKRFIGITMLTLNSQLLMDLKTRVENFPDINAGVLVHKIIVGSPAFNEGLRAGDIIVEINGEAIQSASDVYRLVESADILSVTVCRGSSRSTFNIKPEEVN